MKVSVTIAILLASITPSIAGERLYTVPPGIGDGIHSADELVPITSNLQMIVPAPEVTIPATCHITTGWCGPLPVNGVKATSCPSGWTLVDVSSAKSLMPVQKCAAVGDLKDPQ